MKFRVRAQWYGPGRRVGVASADVEADSACDVLDEALPGEWLIGEFTSANITIVPVPEDERVEEQKKETEKAGCASTDGAER